VLVHFEVVLLQLSAEVFDGSEPSLIVVDDHMSDINQVVADIFTKISHHRNITIYTSLKTCSTKTNMPGR